LEKNHIFYYLDKSAFNEYYVNLLSAYLNEISKWPILTRQQEHSIAKMLQEPEHAKKVFTDKWLLLLSRQQ